MRRSAIVLSLCILPLAAARAQQRTVTLAEAIDLAARADPTVVQAEGGARNAGASVRSAWGSFLPTISSGVSYGRSFSEFPSRTDPITGEVITGGATTGSLGLSASASIPLFTGFRRGAELSAARAGVTAADADVADARARSTLNVSNQFILVLETADRLRALQDAIRRAEEKLAIANTKLVTRASTITDSLQAVVDLARARAGLLSQQRSLTEAEATLARLVGMEGRVSAVADSSLFQVMTVADSAALFAEALSRSPAVVRAEARARSARASVGIYRANYWPSITLTGQTSLSGSSQGSYDLLNARSFNLGLSWPLFNGFVRERALIQADVNRDFANAQAADARRDVSARLTTQLAALRTAEERIALTTQGLEAARANARVQTERYRLGTIGITDLNFAQDALNQAESDAINARYDYLRAKTQTEAILGRKL